MTARPAGDKPKSFNHRRSLDSAGPQRQRRRRPVPESVGWTDGLATIGLINGRDQEGLRPQRWAAEHERDLGRLTRCRWPHTPAAADWHKSANVVVRYSRGTFVGEEAGDTADERTVDGRCPRESISPPVSPSSRVRSSDKQNINNSTPASRTPLNSFGTSLSLSSLRPVNTRRNFIHPLLHTHTHIHIIFMSAVKTTLSDLQTLEFDATSHNVLFHFAMVSAAAHNSQKTAWQW